MSSRARPEYDRIAIHAAGLDTLYVGLYAPILPEVHARFSAAMRDAAEVQGRATWEACRQAPGGGYVHNVFRTGGRWQWILVLPGFWSVRVAERSPGDPAPTLELQLRSSLLWTETAKGALDLACDVLLPELTTGNVLKAIVTRADLALDSSGWELRPEDMPNFVRRARYASACWEPTERAQELMKRTIAAAVGPIIRNGLEDGLDADAMAGVLADAAMNAMRRAGRSTVRSSAHADAEADAQASGVSYHVGQTFTGAAFGRGALRARIYRKDLEISQVSGKTWFHDVWVGRHAWGDEAERQAALREIAATPVWRVEFQCRRAALREFELDTPEQLFKALPSLWRDFTGRWLTLREPKRNEVTGELVQRCRWHLAERWARVRDGWKASGAVPVLRKRLRELSFERSRALAFLATARLVALHADAPEGAAHDPSQAVELSLESFLDELEHRETSWSELVAEYRQRARKPASAWNG